LEILAVVMLMLVLTAVFVNAMSSGCKKKQNKELAKLAQKSQQMAAQINKAAIEVAKSKNLHPGESLPLKTVLESGLVPAIPCKNNSILLKGDARTQVFLRTGGIFPSNGGAYIQAEKPEVVKEETARGYDLMIQAAASTVM